MSIVLERITKRYAGAPVVQDVSLTVATGELCVLLGASGSGKSTILRMIAGLAEVDGGRIELFGEDVTDLPPQRRGIGLVFQHYALFRTMTVGENIEFPLRVRKVRSRERRHRRDELLELVGLAGLAGRMPRQLSGGQQQRVALARALAHQPRVLLLDEPFGALDARIRTELRESIRRIQRELGVTTIFVTHDQEEAFELADRLVVLAAGRVLENGPPAELYLRPQTEPVATFLGNANLLVGEVAGGSVRVGTLTLPLSTRVEAADEGAVTRRVQVLFRPEDVAIETSEDALGCPSLGRAVVERQVFVGAAERLRLRLEPMPGVRVIAPVVPFGSDAPRIDALRGQPDARRVPLAPGDSAWVGVRRLHAIAHPGLAFVSLAASETDPGAVLARELAQRTRARLTVIGERPAPGNRGDREVAQEAQLRRRGLRPGRSSRRGRDLAARLIDDPAVRGADLVIAALGDVDDAAALLAAAARPLLLLPGDARLPTRALVCVAIGEPGKEDVAFTGRLVRHLKAEARVMTVLPADAHAGERPQAERFLASCARTLTRYGVPTTVAVASGEPVAVIRAELAAGGHDLLVLGARLGEDGGPELGAVIPELLEGIRVPVLIVPAGAWA